MTSLPPIQPPYGPPPSPTGEALWNPIPQQSAPGADPGAGSADHPPVGPLPGVRPGALPLEPVAYHQLLRGPRRRWYKPLLCLLLVVPLAFAFVSAAIIPVVVAGVVVGAPDLVGYTLRQVTDLAHLGPVGFVYTNLSLIVLIPAAMLSVWIVHGTRPRFLSSVAGGLRWRWLLRCVLVITPLWLVYIAVGFLLDPTSSARPPHWLALLVIVVLMTPLQSAGEEYLFRGWILQNVGSWFARPVLGLAVSLVISAAAFSAAHTSPDPFVVGTLASLAVTSGIAAWRTGGLEASIVMHAVNNVLTFFVVILFGGWDQAFISSTTTAPPSTLLVAVVVDGLALLLIFWQARRVGLDNRFRPAPTAPQPLPERPLAAPTYG